MTWIPIEPSAQAQASTARLQQAMRDGRPLMLPGGAPRPDFRPAAGAEPAAPVAPFRAAVGVGDVQRLAYRREGGGASGLRFGLGFLTAFAKRWRR